ncbi:helix-turn-helix domain-containing protein [Granulicella paludicola]|uniref:helix-turn-helix domain-containing protein n=1 Tax=Granulicella paludicola TaxID=474951 RepID=UPI0037C0D78D
MHNCYGALAPTHVTNFRHSAPSFTRRFNSVEHRTSFTMASTQSLPLVPVAAQVDTLPRDISSRFGLRLRELRRAHNMTQLRMAVDFGIDRSFISDVERGKKSISLHMLEVIALGMKVSLADLFSGL